MVLDKSRSLYKSRASQRTETEDTVKPLKTRSILSANLSDKSTKIEQPKETKFRSDSLSVSSMPRHGASITNVLPYKERIPCRIKRKKISETLIKGKESIKEPDNPNKRAKADSIIDGKKTSTI